MSKELGKPSKPGAQPVYRNKVFHEQDHDSYKSRGKLQEPTVCPQCGAVFHKGRWQWLPKPATAHSQICPACHRIHDHFPAGYVKLEGAFLVAHRTELISLMRHAEQREKAEHAIQRIVDIIDKDGALLVTTTDIHLARRIGEAIRHAYQGQLTFHYNEKENLLRVHWQR